MPIPIGDLIRMPSGTRELYVIDSGESISHWQRKAASYARKAGVMKFQSCLIVNQDKTVQDAVWIEIIEPIEARKPGRWEGYKAKETTDTPAPAKASRKPGERMGRTPPSTAAA